MIFSTCASPLGIVFGEEKTTGSETKEVSISNDDDDDDTEKFIEEIIKFASKDNAKAVHAGKLITTAFSLLIDDDQEEVSTDEILDSVKKLSDKIDVNHREVMNALEGIRLDQAIKDFHTILTKLKATHATMQGAVVSANEKKLIMKKDTVTLKKYYNTVMKRAGQVSLLKEYNDTVEFLTSPILSSQYPFDIMFEKYKLGSTDAAVVGQKYKNYIDNVMAKIGMSYLYVTAYLKAEEAYDKLSEETTNPTDTLNQLTLTHQKLQGVVKEYERAKKKLESLKKASVQIENTDPAYYYSASIAWIKARDAINAGKKVTFTLYEDWVADQTKGFVDANLIASEKQGNFTNNGEIIVSGTGALTINLNGYQISGGNWDHDILELQGQFNLTINGLSKDKLKSGQVQGINNAKTGINTALDNGNTRRLTLNHVDMSNFKEHAIYTCGYQAGGSANTKVYINGGKFENAQNRCFSYSDTVTFELNKCEFNNNKSKKHGGAIGEIGSDCRAVNSKVTDCSFTNNSAVYQGGAICGTNFDVSAIFVTGCTFTKNSAGSLGGALIGCKEVKNCKFIENSAKSGGALFDSMSMNAITGCTFEGNKSTEDGGAIYTQPGDRITLKDCTFTNNSARSGGAVMTVDRTTLIAENCQFTGNRANENGGALYLTNLRSEWHRLKDVRITGNTAGSSGGGVFCLKKGSPSDVDLVGIVVINDNTAKGKQDNVHLMQKGGTRNCTLADEGLNNDQSKIGINTDLNNAKYVVYNVKSEKPYFGDNGRGTYIDGSQLWLKAIKDGCGRR